MELWIEYEAVKAVDAMSALEVLKYVDSKVVDNREHTMAEYRKMAVRLLKEELA
jgi:hypothetical protein